MNRRSFFAALAAPLIAQPTLEEIERLTWRRKFFPGWSPYKNWLKPGDIVTLPGFTRPFCIVGDPTAYGLVGIERLEDIPPTGYSFRLGAADADLLRRHAVLVLG